jgi:predicted MFS family arabinose efflux permease
MMLGAMIGGGLIDTVGAAGPLLAAATILAIGAIHTSFALRSRTR